MAAMHDPLCNYDEPGPIRTCSCKLIRRVRADDAKQIEGALIAVHDGSNLDYVNGWNAGVHRAIDYLTSPRAPRH